MAKKLPWLKVVSNGGQMPVAKVRRPGGGRSGQVRTEGHAEQAAGPPHGAHGAHGGVARATGG